MGKKGSRKIITDCKEEFPLVPPGFEPLTSVTPIITETTCGTVDYEKYSASAGLPEGVKLGCTNFENCVKVTARWRPEESCCPVLEDAPVFCPTDEEFVDSLKYISEIRKEAENYGICRIIPPASWRPPCLLEDEKTWQATKFATRVQRVERLCNLHMDETKPGFNGDMETEMLQVPASTDQHCCNEGVADTEEDKSSLSKYGFDYGPELSLKSFRQCADVFKSQHFGKNESVLSPESEPSTTDIEGEYWRIIKNPCENTEVIYGSNLGYQTLRSGFPTTSNPSNVAEHMKYVDSGWNLNNVSKLSRSLLSFGCDNTNEILHPQLFIGTCFATQCWRSEEHHLYSLCYMHLGDPTVWYGVPGRYYFKFVDMLRKQFPELSRQPKLLQYLVAQITPSMLIAEGIPVYRCVQNRAEFILIFPGAYHSRFSCGFTCLESARFAPVDWLPHGQNIVELHSEYRFKTLISQDKLLIGAAMKSANAQYDYFSVRKDTSNTQLWRSIGGKDGILSKLLKSRVKLEAIRREHLSNPRQVTVLDESDCSAKTECCTVCLYDLYLSAACCPCSPNKRACLRHVKQLCSSCVWSEKFFVFRFGIDELNLLVEAVEGEPKAIRFWGKRKKRSSSSSKDSHGPSPAVVILSDDEN